MICVKVSSKGQIAIPKGVREKTGIKRNMRLRIETDKDKIFLFPIKNVWRNLEGILKGTDVIDELEKEHKEEIEKDENGIRRMGSSIMVKRRVPGCR